MQRSVKPPGGAPACTFSYFQICASVDVERRVYVKFFFFNEDICC